MNNRITCMDSIRIEDVCYNHYLNLNDDSTFFVNINNLDNKLITINHSGILKSQDVVIGRFNYIPPDYEYWMFTFEDQSVVKSKHTDLIKFEVEIFELLLEKGVIQ